MAKVLFTSVTLLLLALALGANAAPKEAAQINYDLLYTGSDAPKGAMKNLKKAAELAAKSKDCAVVTSGSWLPSKDQMQNHKGDPWMITCKSQADEYYNVYFSN